MSSFRQSSVMVAVMDVSTIVQIVPSMKETVSSSITPIQAAMSTSRGALEMVSATALTTIQQSVGLMAGIVFQKIPPHSIWFSLWKIIRTAASWRIYILFTMEVSWTK